MTTPNPKETAMSYKPGDRVQWTRTIWASRTTTETGTVIGLGTSPAGNRTAVIVLPDEWADAADPEFHYKRFSPRALTRM